MKKNKGITLIALIITIIVMLILVAVSVNVLIKSNLIGTAEKAVDKYKTASEEEANGGTIEINGKKYASIEDYMAGKEKLPDIEAGVRAETNSNYKGATIPKGFTVSGIEEEQTIDGGLVIYDIPEADLENAGEDFWTKTTTIGTESYPTVQCDYNQFVWVPVPDVTIMCDTSNTTKYTLSGTSVTTNKYSKGVAPGNLTGYREPDLVVGTDGTEADANESYYKTILDFESKEKMAEAFVLDYDEMIVSVTKYGGFYIGRYELSETGVKKNKPTLVEENWYNLYNKCKSLNVNEKVETRMIWGCQWDATCDFIANKGEKKDIVDSRSWGNYKNSTGNAAVLVTENETETQKFGSKQNTGYSEYWKANNIYDLAGNCLEWTQEAEDTYYRIYRGGYYNAYSNVSSALDYSDFYIAGNGRTYKEPKIPYVSGGDMRRYSSYFNNKVE